MAENNMSAKEILEDKALRAKRSQMSKESRERRMAAIDKVINFVNELSIDVPAEITKAIRRVKGERQSSGTFSKKNVILDYVRENEPVNEMVFFSEFQLGRLEMRLICNELIKKVSNPSDRVWISFDPEEKTYQIAGTGADIPQGWTGYLPVELQDDDVEDFDIDEEEDDDN